MKKCLACNGKLNFFVNLGKHNYSNQFKKKLKHTPIFNYTVLYCNKCFLIQLKDRPKLKYLRSKNFNLKILEPENHLDNFVSKIIGLKFLKKDSNILGLSYKDKSIIEKIKKKGFTKSNIISNEDYEISNKYGVETIQNVFLTKKKIDKVKKFDLIVSRHLLEHSFKPYKLLKLIKKSLTKDGLIAIEVPCRDKMIKGLDLHYFWEHHITYFNLETLKSFLKIMNFKVLVSAKYKQSSEDNIVIIAKKDQKLKTDNKNKIKNYPKNFLNKFQSDIWKKKVKVKNYFVKIKKKETKITLLGAGHLGIKFMNFYNLHNYFDQIVDDNKKICDLVLPNTKCKITNSRNMKKDGIFFSSLNHESQIKFKKKHKFLEKKVKIFSISSYGNNPAPFN